MRTKTVDFVKMGIRDVSVRSITIKAIDANDMIVAASRCVPPEGTTLDANIFQILIRQHMVLESITEVDGQKLTGPCLDYLKWEQRTREFVSEIYDFVNYVETDERQNFRKALAGGGDGQNTSTTSNAV